MQDTATHASPDTEVTIRSSNEPKLSTDVSVPIYATDSSYCGYMRLPEHKSADDVISGTVVVITTNQDASANGTVDGAKVEGFYPSGSITFERDYIHIRAFATRNPAFDGSPGHDEIQLHIGRNAAANNLTFGKIADHDGDANPIYAIARALAENRTANNEEMTRILEGFSHGGGHATLVEKTVVPGWSEHGHYF